MREWECQEPRVVVAVRNTGPIQFRVNVISASRRECGIKGVRLCWAKRMDGERSGVNVLYAHAYDNVSPRGRVYFIHVVDKAREVRR